MGRKKINTEDKKKAVSITLSKENFKKIKDTETSSSKLINWLLEEHFNSLSK